VTNYESRAQPGRFLMPHIMCPTTEDIISYILNWVCPELRGPIGKRTKEFAG
jgi:hypothetical protein